MALGELRDCVEQLTLRKEQLKQQLEEREQELDELRTVHRQVIDPVGGVISRGLADWIFWFLEKMMTNCSGLYDQSAF